MIKLNPAPTFDARVSLTQPGVPDPAEIGCTFRHMPVSQVGAWFERTRDLPAHNALQEIIVGWSGVQDADGAEVPFGGESLAALLDNYPAATRELLLGWQKALSESRIKN